jgi:RNA polymerase sigma-70 factor, ECF subfamily
VTDVDDLVRAAQHGDRPAFEALYTRFGRLVHGVLLCRVGRADVEDLVQEVFLTAFERLSTLRDPSAFGGWLAAIARRRAIDHRRRLRPADELPDDVAAPETGHAEAAQILAVIERLPDAYRETLVLRLVEGMTGPEIAARTGLTEGSVRVNLHRGMKLLRENLSGQTESALSGVGRTSRSGNVAR